MSKSLYSGVNKVYFRSYLLLNIVASSAFIKKLFEFDRSIKCEFIMAGQLSNYAIKMTHKTQGKW